MAFAPAFRAPFQPPISKPTGLTRYTLTLQPDSTTGIDTHTRENTPDSSFGNLNLVVRGVATANNIILIKFNLSTIPSGASIVSAVFTLTVASAGVGQTITANRILSANSAWTESSTWNYAVPSSVRWAGDTGGDGGTDAGCSVSGIDYSATTLGTIASQGGTVGTEYPLTLNTTEFALMVASNNGITVRGSVDAFLSFAACENATAAYRPKLVVVYDA